MAEQQRINQEQNIVETGNVGVNGLQDEFTAANNGMERGQVPQRIPEEKSAEAQVQGGGSAISESMQNDQRISHEGNQPDGGGDQQRGGEQAIYRGRGT